MTGWGIAKGIGVLNVFWGDGAGGITGAVAEIGELRADGIGAVRGCGAIGRGGAEDEAAGGQLNGAGADDAGVWLKVAASGGGTDLAASRAKGLGLNPTPGLAGSCDAGD